MVEDNTNHDVHGESQLHENAAAADLSLSTENSTRSTSGGNTAVAEAS